MESCDARTNVHKYYFNPQPTVKEMHAWHGPSPLLLRCTERKRLFIVRVEFSRGRGAIAWVETKRLLGALEQARRGGSRVQRERKNKAMSADSWTREYGDVKASWDELYELIRERNSMTAASASSTGGGAREQDVHKLSAQCRRKLTSLSNKINDLEAGVGVGGGVTQREASRRTELVHALRVRKDQLKDLMSRDGQRKSERTKLLGGAGEGQRRPGAETADTAGLDSRGILQLQKQALRSQEDEIAELGAAVRQTKHVALAINEEVDLHQHLLDDLDSSVDNTQSMMKFARRKLEQVSRKSGSCKYIMVMILLVVVLALVISMSHMLTS